MEYLDLEDLIKRGESQTLELKRSLSLQDKGLEALCAMMNSDLATGIVIFGVEPNKSICGVEVGNLDTAQRSLSQTIKGKFDPSLVALLEIKEINGKTLLIISAKRDKSVPYYEYDGRAWIREGSTNRLLSLSEKQALTRQRNRDTHSGPWKCDKCGAWVGVLCSVELTDKGMKKTYKHSCGGEFWPAS